MRVLFFLVSLIILSSSVYAQNTGKPIYVLPENSHTDSIATQLAKLVLEKSDSVITRKDGKKYYRSFVSGEKTTVVSLYCAFLTQKNIQQELISHLSFNNNFYVFGTSAKNRVGVIKNIQALLTNKKPEEPVVGVLKTNSTTMPVVKKRTFLKKVGHFLGYKLWHLREF